MKLRSHFAVLACLTSTQLFAQQDHQAATMMAPAQAPMSEEKFAESLKEKNQRQAEQTILAAFRQSHTKPRIAVFWNQQFPSRISDWYSSQRANLSAKGELQVSGGQDPREEKGRGNLTTEFEQRSPTPRNTSGNSLALGLQSGLVSAFQQGGASVIDQAMAQRLTDNALEDGTFERTSPDQLRLQMKALTEHADYVLELVVSDDFARDGLYQVRVISVKDASIVALLSTDGVPPGAEENSAWVITNAGFEKRERPLPMTTTGKEIALHAMAAMSH